MKLLIVKNGNFSKDIDTSITDEQVSDYNKLINASSRVSIYGFPLAMFLWVWIAWPIVFPTDRNIPFLYAFSAALSILLLTPLIHELIHLLALPQKIKLPDTLFVLSLNGIRSNFAIRPGGKIIRGQLIWSSILPLMVLTICPFVALISGHHLPIWVGFAAAYNFGLSAIDIMQFVYLCFFVAPGYVIREG